MSKSRNIALRFYNNIFHGAIDYKPRFLWPTTKDMSGVKIQQWIHRISKLLVDDNIIRILVHIVNNAYPSWAFSHSLSNQLGGDGARGDDIPDLPCWKCQHKIIESLFLHKMRGSHEFTQELWHILQNYSKVYWTWDILFNNAIL